MTMKMQFDEFVKTYGLKEGIDKVKSKKTSHHGYGEILENTIYEALSSTDLRVERTTPKEDVGFGADFLIKYKEADKNYSLYLDVTLRRKEGMRYLKQDGTITKDCSSAFSIKCNSGEVYFGIKEHHHQFFRYQKPVVLLYIKSTGEVSISEMEAKFLTMGIIAANDATMKLYNCGARASKVVYANPTMKAKAL